MIQTNNCVECGCDTSFGSGNFVNRIPALTDTHDGWMCVECQSMECDDCGELTLEWHTDEDGGFVCESCLNKT